MWWEEPGGLHLQVEGVLSATWSGVLATLGGGVAARGLEVEVQVSLYRC